MSSVYTIEGADLGVMTSVMPPGMRMQTMYTDPSMRAAMPPGMQSQVTYVSPDDGAMTPAAQPSVTPVFPSVTVSMIPTGGAAVVRGSPAAHRRRSAPARRSHRGAAPVAHHSRGLHDGQLGDALCFRWEQRAAEQAVTAMNAAYESLGSPMGFSGAVAGVNAEWAKQQGWFTDWTLCGAKAVGQQAEALTQRMLAASGQSSAAASPYLEKSALDQLSGAAVMALKVISAVAVTSLVVWGGFKAYEVSKLSPRRSASMQGYRSRRRR